MISILVGRTAVGPWRIIIIGRRIGVQRVAWLLVVIIALNDALAHDRGGWALNHNIALAIERPVQVCRNCGYYRGRQVRAVDEEQ